MWTVQALSLVALVAGNEKHARLMMQHEAAIELNSLIRGSSADTHANNAVNVSQVTPQGKLHSGSTSVIPVGDWRLVTGDAQQNGLTLLLPRGGRA